MTNAKVEDNAAGGLQFTDQELKEYDRKTFNKGATIDQLQESTKCAKRTLYMWLEDLINEDKRAPQDVPDGRQGRQGNSETTQGHPHYPI